MKKKKHDHDHRNNNKHRGLIRPYPLVLSLLMTVLIAVAPITALAWPHHDSQTWWDDLGDDAGIAVLDNVALNTGDLHLRGQVDLLGRAMGDESTYTSVLVSADDGMIYGGTMGMPGSSKALRFSYDPTQAWTEGDHSLPGSNPLILGEPFPQDTYEWRTGAFLCIWDMV